MRDVTNKAPVISIENLKVEYKLRHGAFTAVDDVTLAVSPGEILGLVGESGAGKSTIGNAIAGLIDFPGEITRGRIVLTGIGDLAGLNESQFCAIRGRHIGMIFQDSLSALFPVKTIGAQLLRAIRLGTGMTGRQARKRALALLEEVGIPDPKTRLRQYPHQFSGGMRQRVVIAIALAGNPRLLIADEPTTALDVSIQHGILALLRRLASDHNAGVILVTHDMAVIEDVADRVAVMYRGRLIEQGTTRDVLTNPAHDYTKALIRAVPRIDRRVDRFVTMEAPCAPVERQNKGVTESREGPQSGPIVDVRKVSIRFMTKKALLARNHNYICAADEVSLSIPAGCSLGIVGESGSGKSTLARAICGLQPVDSGTIHLMGHDINTLSRDPRLRAERVKVQMIFQDPFASLNPRQRIGSALVEPLVVNRMADPEQARDIARAALLRVGMKAEDAGKLPHQFSGGQRQRLCIARALVLEPTVLICDEPTSGLDVSVQAVILNSLKELREERNLTLLFISHDLAVIRHVSDRVVVMRHGRVCEDARTETLFETPRHDYTRHLLRMMPKFTAGARLQAR